MLTLIVMLVYLLFGLFTLVWVADNIPVPLRVCVLWAVLWPITLSLIGFVAILQFIRKLMRGY